MEESVILIVLTIFPVGLLLQSGSRAAILGHNLKGFNHCIGEKQKNSPNDVEATVILKFYAKCL